MLYFAAVNDQLPRATGVRFALRVILLLCATLLFAASVWWDNAANRGIAPSPSTPIPYTDVPRGGINTYNLHAEVIFNPDGSVAPDNKVQRTFIMIAAAGIHWVRVQFPWEDIQPCRGSFVDCRPASQGASTWAKYDYIVAQAEQHGLELIVRLDTPPAWAREAFINSPEVQAATAAGAQVTGPPDNLDDYGDFVAAVAERYGDRLRFFQIWNEPNLLREWNYHQQDPAEFVQLLRLASDRIKAVNPSAVILSPALSPTDGAGDGANDLEYLQGIYEAGGAAYFDILSAQLYGLGQPPTEHRYVTPGDSLLRPIKTKVDVGRVVLLREIMERNGDALTPVWISELGWNSAPPDLPQEWGAPVSETLKGTYLIQAMERAEREWPWMGPMCIWMFRWGGEPPNPADPTPYFQLVDFDFSPLPAYDRVQTYLATDASNTLPRAQRNLIAATAPAATGLLVLLSSIAVCASVGNMIAALAPRSRPQHRNWPKLAARWTAVFGFRQRDGLMLALLGVTLALAYWGSAQLPITALGMIIFAGLALLRPDLALVFVPITVPLFVAPKGIWDERFGIRPSGIRFPIHEAVLWIVVAATLVRPRAVWQAVRRIDLRKHATLLLPIGLFAVAGTLGVVVAAARGPALREWRWLIVEPLVWYGLVRFWARDTLPRWRLVWAYMIAGVVIAGVGLVQLGGINLAALLPQSICFSDRVVIAEGGLGRISSIYCHPNNLGLALGRIWPIWAALALIAFAQASTDRRRIFQRVLLAAGAAVCLAALVATLSKGALLGAFVALLVLGVLLRQHNRSIARWLLIGAALGAIGVLALGLALGVERLNPLGGSSGARVELWTSALRMIRDHPLTGVGLDQFLHYRTAPEFADRYIDPAARATSEQNAPHPHNLILDALVRTGPLGMLALAWLVLHALQQSFRLRDQPGREGALAIGLLASIVAALTHGLVDSFYSWTDLAFGLWLTLGLLDSIRMRHGSEQIVEGTAHDGSNQIGHQPAPAHARADRT